MSTNHPFLKQETWNYITIANEVLTGSNIFRTIKFFATENTVVKFLNIHNNGDDGSNIQYAVVMADENYSSGIRVCYGWAWDYHDFINEREFVVPSGYWLMLCGSALSGYSVGFTLTYKGGLVQKADYQTT